MYRSIRSRPRVILDMRLIRLINLRNPHGVAVEHTHLALIVLGQTRPRAPAALIPVVTQKTLDRIAQSIAGGHKSALGTDPNDATIVGVDLDPGNLKPC